MFDNKKILYTLDDIENIFNNGSSFKKKNKIKIEKVCFDSRQIIKNSLFVAIKGETNDGHEYIEQSINNGAVCIICEYIPDDVQKYVDKDNIVFVVVENSLKALQKIAIFQRNRIKAKVIGITGSFGKTTTREMLKVVLCDFYKINTTERNYNSQIGLPYIICNTNVDTDILILEMGMSYKGEMNILSEIARPDIAIITKIAPVHIANFNSINEIVQAKSEIMNGMSNSGVLILDADGVYYDEIIKVAKRKNIKNIFTIGTNDNANLYCSNCTFSTQLNTLYDVYIDNKVYKCKLNGIIKHNVFNSLFALAVANILNIDMGQAIKKLENFKIVTGRGDLENIKINNDKQITIINDCYNSGPDSLCASIEYLDVLKKMKPNNKIVAIIGDMLELGSSSSKYHQQIVEKLINTKIDCIILVGKESKIIFDNLISKDNKFYFNNTELLEEQIINFISNYDVVMFKASRGMHFEKLINKIKCKK